MQSQMNGMNALINSIQAIPNEWHECIDKAKQPQMNGMNAL